MWGVGGVGGYMATGDSHSWWERNMGTDTLENYLADLTKSIYTPPCDPAVLFPDTHVQEKEALECSQQWKRPR
jgi:hypothetical protein